MTGFGSTHNPPPMLAGVGLRGRELSWQPVHFRNSWRSNSRVAIIGTGDENRPGGLIGGLNSTAQQSDGQKGGIMANAPPERLEDEMFRLFEDLREKRLRRAAVGLFMDLLDHVIVNEQRKPSGVIPKAAELREGTVAACRRAIRSILSFLLLQPRRSRNAN